MSLNLKIWRQQNANDKGGFQTYQIENISSEMSFLEMLDVLNEKLVNEGEEPVAFDHDCREGICGACSLHINGQPHGPWHKTTTCQLHMREYKDGDTIVIEPFRAKAFPIIKDLVTDRKSLDRIIEAGGYVSVNTGNAVDANAIPIEKAAADDAFAAAACIGCGACVAACKNASAMLFLSAKVAHLAKLPQGQVERKERVVGMVNQMDDEGFGSCTNTQACEAVCPKGISIQNIGYLNKEYIKSIFDGSKISE